MTISESSTIHTTITAICILVERKVEDKASPLGENKSEFDRNKRSNQK
jgi:hypothetical protein